MKLTLPSQNLLLPVKQITSLHELSDHSDDDQFLHSPNFKSSRGSASGSHSNKSSFSRKSMKQKRPQTNGDFTSITADSCDTFGLAALNVNETRVRNYPMVYREDFDRSKEFEDVAVRMLNEMNVIKVHNPEGIDHFSS